MTGSIASIATLLRLSFAGSSADRHRAALVAAGAALGTIFSLAALLVLSIDGYDERYTNGLLREPGLRPGVATVCWLLLIPVLIFIGMCTRVCAAQRERRFATFRLAGATPSQIRLIAAAETGLATITGATVGTAIFLLVKAILASRVDAGERLTLPVTEPFPWVSALLFGLLLPLLTGLASAIAMRRVVIGPLGVARRQSRSAPAGWPAVLLAGGPLAVIIGARLNDQHLAATWQLLLIVGVASSCIGLLCASTWFASVSGRVIARATGRADWLIAARRLEADPRGQSWSMSSVVICAFLAAVIAIVKADTLTGNADDAFYNRGFELANLALLIAAAVAATGVLVGIAEGILERRRSLAALTAAGTPLTMLRRAVMLQGLVPLVPAIVLATALGAGSVYALSGTGADAGQRGVPLPWYDLGRIIVMGLTVSTLASACSLPFLHRSVRPGELRYD